jgi:tetratricopeptide (TPR) repeat protein
MSAKHDENEGAVGRGRFSFWLVIVMTAALAYLSFQKSAANVFLATNPSVALMIHDANDAAAIKLAGNQQVAGNKNYEAEPTANLATAAIRGQAINAPAIRVLGYALGDLGQAAKSKRLIEMAQGISRRDGASQFWLLKHALATENLLGVLKHFDILLRTNASAGDVMFPVLTKAVAAEPENPIFKPYMNSDAPWLFSFLAYAIGQSENPSKVAKLWTSSGVGLTPVQKSDLSVRLINRMVAERQYSEARDFYSALDGSDNNILTSAGFTEKDANGTNGALGWTFVNDATFGAGLEASGEKAGLILRAFVGSGESAIVANRLLFLSPGRYTLSANYRKNAGNDGGTARWELQCNKAIGSLSIPLGAPDAAATPSNFSTNFTIDPQCLSQFLQLRVAADAGSSDFELEVQNLTIRKSPTS